MAIQSTTGEGFGDSEYHALDGPAGKSMWLRHFALMACAFAVNHGCVTATIAIGSSDFNPNLSAVSNATLYITYTLGALLLAVPMVKIYGPHRCLVIGLTAYVFYVLPYAIIVVGGKDLDLRVQYAIAAVGSAIGGAGAGLLWTAQGAYFSRAAELYALETGRPREDVNGYFGGVFSTIYVGMEVIAKLFSSVVRDSWSDGGKVFVFMSYLTLCIISAFAMTFAKKLPRKEEDDDLMLKDEKPSCFALMLYKLKAIKKVSSDPKIWLVAPLNLAFGYTASWVAQYLNGTIAKTTVGGDNVGYLTAVIPGYAALAGVPYAFLGRKFGKGPMMVLGCLSFFTLGMIGWLVPLKTLENSGWGGMIGLYLIMGNGRAVFESTNKAVFADFFPDNAAGAFAMFGVQSGLAGAFGFIVFLKWLHMAAVTNSIILVVIGSISLVLVPMAFVLHHSEQKSKQSTEALLGDVRA